MLESCCKQITVSSLAFQFCYTTIFGWYVSFVFLRLGSVWPPIICHIFCNIMGFPDISGIYDRKKPAERTSKLQAARIFRCEG